MPKLQNVTEAEIKAVVEAMEGPLQDMHEIANRMEKGYCDELSNPIQLAKDFALLARASTNLMVWIIAKRAMQEQAAEMETLMAERARLKAKGE